ncbi:MAG: hypothetical protein H8E71_00510 [Candidatus Marinimicrobia bacterium]|nr:hypothetical protein [Candidatus Neomarinimicrobiota bacterium]
MIKYNYTLNRFEGKYFPKKKYSPDKIPSEIHNISYLEGSNSSGKSTLMNILAISFFGHKKNGINATLKEDMEGLIKDPDDELKFNVDIDNEILGIKIKITKKKNNDPTLEFIWEKKGKKKKLTADEVERRINLIYDLPDNPRHRLSELLKDIKFVNMHYASRIANFRTHLNNLLLEISNTPSKKDLEKKESNVLDITNQLADLEDNIKANKKLLNDLNKYYLSIQYNHKKRLLDEFKREFKDLEKKKKLIKTSNNKSTIGLADLINSRDNFNRHIFNIRAEKVNPILDMILSDNKESKANFKIWKDINIQDEYLKSKSDSLLLTYIEQFKSIIDDKINSLVDNKTKKEINLISELIRVLDHYQHSTLTITGIQIDLQELLNSLKDKEEDYKSIKEKERVYSNCKNSLSEIENYFLKIINEIIPKINENRSKMKDNAQAFMYNDESIKNELAKLKDRIQLTGAKLDSYKQRLNGLNINIKNTINIISKFRNNKEYQIFHEKDHDTLLRNKKDIEEKLDDLKNELNRKFTLLSISKTELKKLKKKKPHKYKDHYKLLNNYFEVLQTMERCFRNDFDKYIRSLIERKVNKKSMTKDENNYSIAISKFLANKVRHVRHVDETYVVSRIDMIDNKIITQTGKELKLKQLGTGQGQAAYLDGLLSTTDERPMVVLFDEVAAMDMESLKPIFKKIQYLYRNNKILCGLIVQKSNDKTVKIEDINEMAV